MERVALYARVSTSNGNQDPEMQLRELREHAEHRNWQITGEFVDRGVSGSKDSRCTQSTYARGVPAQI
jgi:DNA invertase Pin-like site-specific DNA recombinase